MQAGTRINHEMLKRINRDIFACVSNKSLISDCLKTASTTVHIIPVKYFCMIFLAKTPLEFLR